MTALYVVKGFLYILSSPCSRTLCKTCTALAIQTVKTNDQNSKRGTFSSTAARLSCFSLRVAITASSSTCAAASLIKKMWYEHGIIFYELLKYTTTHNPKDLQRKHLFALNAVLHSHFESLKCPATIIVPLITKAHRPTAEVTWRSSAVGPEVTWRPSLNC